MSFCIVYLSTKIHIPFVSKYIAHKYNQGSGSWKTCFEVIKIYQGNFRFRINYLYLILKFDDEFCDLQECRRKIVIKFFDIIALIFKISKSKLLNSIF